MVSITEVWAWPLGEAITRSARASRGRAMRILLLLARNLCNSYPVKALKALATSSALILAALTAHILAGGGQLSFYSGLLLVGALLLIALFISGPSESPVRTVLAIFFAQNLSHFITGGSYGDENRMILSHLLSAVASYFLITYLHRTLPAITDFFLTLVLPRVFLNPFSLRSIKAAPGFSYRSLATPFFSLTHSLRAPPLS